MSREELDKRIDKALSGWAIPSKRDKKAIWHSVHTTIRTKRKRIISLEKWQWAIAASLTAIIVSYAIFYNSTVEFSTNINQKVAISLPDGSSVNLNAESKASYNSITWYFNRSINLSGEAFFKVKKGSQFNVITNNGVIKVLGTSFNVFSRDKNFLVKCFTGKVEVDNSINKILITKGEKVTQTENLKLSKEVFANNIKPEWLIDNYTYAKVKLETVFIDIEKSYNVSISADKKIVQMTFSGEWNNSMALKDVLKIVCMPFSLETKTINNKDIEIQLALDK